MQCRTLSLAGPYTLQFGNVIHHELRRIDKRVWRAEKMVYHQEERALASYTSTRDGFNFYFFVSGGGVGVGEEKRVKRWMSCSLRAGSLVWLGYLRQVRPRADGNGVWVQPRAGEAGEKNEVASSRLRLPYLCSRYPPPNKWACLWPEALSDYGSNC